MQTLRLITTDKQLRLLEALLYSDNEKLRVRKLAVQLKMNPGYVSTLLKRMEKEKLVKKGMLCNTNTKLQALRFIFNIDRLTSAWKRLSLIGVLGFGVFGSWAKGTNLHTSDLDVWVMMKSEPDVECLGQLRQILREESGASEVSITILTASRVKQLKNKDQLFYSSLLNSFHIGGCDVD
jgi:predicted nucleotidyltransferase